jgi:hypothetical protein
MTIRNSVQFGTLFFKNPSVGNILGSNHDDYKNICFAMWLREVC